MKADILKALRYKSINAWQGRITEAEKYTCDWFVDLKGPPDGFWKWLSNPDEPIFWISGKAGSGKSTLMRYIYDHADVDESLKQWAGAHQVTRAAFFFCEQDDKLLSSREGMLRSVLHQVLISRKDLISHAYPNLFHHDPTFHAEDLTTWSSLNRAFQALLKNAPDFRFFLLIDGLDEFRMHEKSNEYNQDQRELAYDGENEDEGWGINAWITDGHNQLAKFIIDCKKYTNIKICVACRELSSFEDRFSKLPRVKVQEHTRTAIEQYSTQRLEEEVPRLVHHQRLVSSITSKAQGVFLWVQLVVTSIIRGFQNGKTLEELEDGLQAIPPRIGGRNGLYMQMLRGIDPANLIEAFQLFDLTTYYWQKAGSWTTSAELVVTFFAQESLNQSLSQKIDEVEKQHPWGVFQDEPRQSQLEKYRRRLTATTMGLLEAHGDEYAVIKFTHLTARQFVNRQKTRGFFRIPPFTDSYRELEVVHFMGLLRRFKSDLEFMWHVENTNNIAKAIRYANLSYRHESGNVVRLLNVLRLVLDYWSPKEPTLYSRICLASSQPQKSAHQKVDSDAGVSEFLDLAVLAGWFSYALIILNDRPQIPRAKLQTLLDLITYKFATRQIFTFFPFGMDCYQRELDSLLHTLIARGGDLNSPLNTTPDATPWTACVEKICNAISLHLVDAPAALELFLKHGAHQEAMVMVGERSISVRDRLLEAMGRHEKLRTVIREATMHTRLQTFINVPQGVDSS